MLRNVLLHGSIFGALLTLGMACGSEDSSTSTTTGSANSGATTVGSGGEGGATSNGGASSSTADSISVGVGTGGSGGMTQTLGCSDDLQSVTDELGMVIETCPPDQGCAEGMCVAACEAAAKSKGSLGCEYLTMTPPFLGNATTSSTLHGSCYAVFVANAWGRHAKLQVEFDGQSKDVTGFARIPSNIGANASYKLLPAQGLPPGEVAVLFLSHKPGTKHPIGASLECPVTPAVTLDTAIHKSGRGKGFSITSDTPITGYDILPFGGASSFLPSASLLYPRTAWGTNYLVVAPHGGNSGKQWVGIVAKDAATSVTLLSPTYLPGSSGLMSITPNMQATISLQAGEVVQYHGADPTGLVIQSDKPVGVFAGNDYLRVPHPDSPGGGGQDSAHQQLPHIGAMGHEYVGGGVVTRRADLTPEESQYRIVGVVDDTQLTWDPAPPAGAPSTLNRGDVVEFGSTEYFFVSAQDKDHPFSLTQYLGGAFSNSRPGCGPTPPFMGIQCGMGDEEWVVMTPPGQFLRRYVFFVDPTYATTNLVITRQKGPNGFSDVNIACLGKVEGFQPVGNAGNYEVAHVDLFRGFVGTKPACETSSHSATSDGDFGMTVWGTDYYASYGYPAGGNLSSLTTVIVKPEPPK